MGDLHLDCFSGLAGDMFLGACLDLGMPVEPLVEAVAALGLPGVAIESRKAARGGVTGTRFRVLLDGRPIEGPDPDEAAPEPHAHTHGHDHPHPHPHPHDHPHPPAEERGLEAGEAPPPVAPAAHAEGSGDHRHEPQRGLAEIRDLLARSALAPPVKERALQLFSRLGEAESRVHGVPLERVHFHEVGAIDSIVDLVGAAAAVEHLAPGRITCGPVNVGGGSVTTAHGELPVPAPATAALLSGVPVYGSAGGELLTPTGAVLLAELVDDFTGLPAMTLESVGYGLGRREVPGRPNACRLLAGSAEEPERGEVLVVECEVDDLPGEGFGFLMERLLGAGALDVFFTPVQMKKNRPGTLVTLLCRPSQMEPLAAVLLGESGSLGCRYRREARIEAERTSDAVITPFGTVAVKRARWAGHDLGGAPEYDDCRRLAVAAGVPWREVYRAALAALGGGGRPVDG